MVLLRFTTLIVKKKKKKCQTALVKFEKVYFSLFLRGIFDCHQETGFI